MDYNEQNMNNTDSSQNVSQTYSQPVSQPYVESAPARPVRRVPERKETPGFIAPLLIGLCIVISCAILAGAFYKVKSADSRTIGATGSASVDFEADLIVWRGYFTAYSENSSRAYDQIKKEASWVEDYLKNKGVSESDYVFSAVDISENTKSNYDEYGNYINTTIEGYTLSQNVVISSSDIDLVEEISRDISKLLDKGVQLTSGTPEYYCTGLDEIKLDLIEQATDNAKTRVKIMADQSGASIGKLRTSNLGVFQITARNSGTSYYSYDGYLDTTSRQKTATITVRLEYDIN